MHEFRQNPATGEWVIIATERSKRPEDFKSKKAGNKILLPPYDPACPFCKGNKAEAEASLYQIDDKEGWQLRVLLNKYAALNDSENPERVADGMFLKAGGYGISEVIIETPHHNSTIATMNIETVEEIIKAYKTRYNEISKDDNITFINIFRNHGSSAGASLVHPHSQIIGSLVTPPHVSDQIYHARQCFNTWGTCIYCDILNEEIKRKERIVLETDHFVAFCPYASRSPFEIRIFPKRHSSVFGNIMNEEKDLALILKTVLAKLYKLLDHPEYNYVIRSIGTNDGEVQFYHWYLVIIPRITGVAGFEIGTGMYINVTTPEDCAELLRNEKVE